MIKYNPKSWFKLIFALQKSDTLRILWKELIYSAVLSTAITFLIITYAPMRGAILHELVAVFSLVGFVISLLLVFRTNTAYDRWWEGRKKWGELVNDSRNLAIKLATLSIAKENRDFFRRMISNFVFATKEHLRNGVIWEELDLTADELAELQSKEHVPNVISLMIYKRVKHIRDEGVITDEQFIIIDKNLNALLDSLGACERIKNTPIPFSYSLFLKKFIFLYVSTLPLAFVVPFGYFSVLITTAIFYVLVSIEVLAEEIEDPFGMDDNDLPTDNLCEKIQANVNEIFKVS